MKFVWESDDFCFLFAFYFVFCRLYLCQFFSEEKWNQTGLVRFWIRNSTLLAICILISGEIRKVDSVLIVVLASARIVQSTIFIGRLTSGNMCIVKLCVFRTWRNTFAVQRFMYYTFFPLLQLPVRYPLVVFHRKYSLCCWSFCFYAVEIIEILDI